MPIVLRPSAADFGRVRLATSPLWECSQAVRALVDPRLARYHGPWLEQIRRDAAALDLGPLMAVQVRHGWVPDFLTPPPEGPAPSIAAELARVRATPVAAVAGELIRCRASQAGGQADAILGTLIADPERARSRLADGLASVWERLVRPSWPRIAALLEADLAIRAQALADHGLQRTIDGLHRRVRWREGAIAIDDPADSEHALDGRGLVLMPSAFAWPAIAAVVDRPWQPTLIYPARGIAALWRERPGDPAAALAGLVGRNRARVLLAVGAAASTTAVAERLGLGASGVSAHLKALEAAGLVGRRRRRREVLYARTWLGDALVRRRAR